MVSESVVEAPPDWVGTLPEYLVYKELVKIGIEFEYQANQMGGRLSVGGAVVDFLIPSLNLALQIQGLYWHYQRSSTQKARDAISRASLEGMGLTVIYLDEDDLMRNPNFYVKEALEMRDYSKLAGM